MILIEEIGGTHINYYLHCKRMLWYYLNNINLEQNNEYVTIANIDHNKTYKRESLREINIGPIKVDIINKHTISEIKISKNEKENYKYQLIYYIYYLNKHLDMNIKKGILLYPKINKRVEITPNKEDFDFIEKILSEIQDISKQSENKFPVLNNGKCKNCSFFHLCYIQGEDYCE